MLKHYSSDEDKEKFNKHKYKNSDKEENTSKEKKEDREIKKSKNKSKKKEKKTDSDEELQDSSSKSQKKAKNKKKLKDKKEEEENLNSDEKEYKNKKSSKHKKKEEDSLSSDNNTRKLKDEKEEEDSLSSEYSKIKKKSKHKKEEEESQSADNSTKNKEEKSHSKNRKDKEKNIIKTKMKIQLLDATQETPVTPEKNNITKELENEEDLNKGKEDNLHEDELDKYHEKKNKKHLKEISKGEEKSELNENGKNQNDKNISIDKEKNGNKSRDKKVDNSSEEENQNLNELKEKDRQNKKKHKTKNKKEEKEEKKKYRNKDKKNRDISSNEDEKNSSNEEQNEKENIKNKINQKKEGKENDSSTGKNKKEKRHKKNNKDDSSEEEEEKKKENDKKRKNKSKKNKKNSSDSEEEKESLKQKNKKGNLSNDEEDKNNSSDSNNDKLNSKKKNSKHKNDSSSSSSEKDKNKKEKSKYKSKNNKKSKDKYSSNSKNKYNKKKELNSSEDEKSDSYKEQKSKTKRKKNYMNKNDSNSDDEEYTKKKSSSKKYNKSIKEKHSSPKKKSQKKEEIDTKSESEKESDNEKEKRKMKHKKDSKSKIKNKKKNKIKSNENDSSESENDSKKKKKNSRKKTISESDEEEDKSSYDKKKEKRKNKSKRRKSSESDKEESFSYEKEKKKKLKKAKHKNSDDSDNSDDDGDKSKDKKNRHKNKDKKKNKRESEDSRDENDSYDEKKHKKIEKKSKKEKNEKKHKNSEDSDFLKESRKSRYEKSSKSNSENESKKSKRSLSESSSEEYKKSKQRKDKKNKNSRKDSIEEMIDDLKEGEKKLDEINKNSDSEKENYKSNEDEKETTSIKRKESDDIIPHTKNGNIVEKKIEEIKDIKNESGKFLINEEIKNSEKHKNKIDQIIKNFKICKSTLTNIIKEFTDSDEKIKFFKNNGFILTNKSKERLALLIHYNLIGVPVLLEGSTGTAKTRTSLIAANYINKFIFNEESEKKVKLIRFNLSEETRIDDMTAKFVNDNKSITGLSVKEGPFVEAYRNGDILLLDEINLAPSNVLQCIQQSLDNELLSVETNGNTLLEVRKNKNFALVATQNPNKGAFAGKRHELSSEFISRFKTIYFPEIEKSEMEEIGIGIAKNIGYIKDEKKNSEKKQLIKNIVDIHFKWVEWDKKNNSQNEVLCYTIREIESVLECLNNNEDIYDVIMTVYGGRYRKNEKEELIKLINSYGIKKNNKLETKNIVKKFNFCYVNNSLLDAINSIFICLNNKQNIILLGNNESGLTQIAEWCAEYFNNKNGEKDGIFDICYCTKNLECTELIGSQKLISENGKDELRFEPGFLYNSIKEGKCIVLDNINEAPSRVIERLNGLLDKKNNEEENYFEVPEYSRKPKLKIDECFRIIATSNFDKINQISPAFVNRFQVITLEDQFSIRDKEGIKNLLSILIKKYQIEYYENNKNNKERAKKETEKRIFDKNKKKEIEIKKELILTEEQIYMLLEKINILSKFSNPYDLNNTSNNDSILNALELNNNEIDENSKKYLTMSSLNKFIRSVVILANKFSIYPNIEFNLIVNFAFELLFEEKLSDNNKDIYDVLIKELIEKNKEKRNLGDEEYFFDESKTLKNFMVQLYACSLINQYLCIIGPPGIGKTIGARAFAYIREKILGIEYENPFYMHTFNQFTRPSDYYGVSSMQDGKLVFRKGPLTKSMKQGNVFIGDEFNISSEDCMKAITPCLELKYNKYIIIPGIENKIKINPNFFFIICQNTRETFGRKELPEKIKVKIKIINYPDRIQEEIEKICVSIYKKKFKNESEIFTREEAKKCGTLMMRINEEETLNNWSLRDISKLFTRMHKQVLCSSHFKNIGIEENILFYILSSTNDSLVEERLNLVCKLLADIFGKKELEEELKELYHEEPKLKHDKRSNKIYIKKGNISLYYRVYEENLYEELNNLPSILNALFEMILSSDNEPILISGPSSFKTYLAKNFLIKSNVDIVSLNSEITMSQLIGSNVPFIKEDAKLFYLRAICEILRINNIESKLKYLENFNKNKEKIKELIEKEKEKIDIRKNSWLEYSLTNFEKKLFEDDKKSKISSNKLLIEFQPGILLSAIIKKRLLILKKITDVKTENLERLNECLTGNKKITLNEDIQNTYTDENKKEIDLGKDFRIIATCNEGEESKLSDAFLSRFSLIFVNKYSKNEEKNVIKKKRRLEKLDEYINKYFETFKQDIEFNLAQKMNCFRILKELNKIRENLEEENLKLSVYILLLGLTPNREKILDNTTNQTYIQKLNLIFKLDEYYDNNLSQSPLKKKKNIIQSLLYQIKTEFSLKEKEKKDEDINNDIIFTLKMKNLLDIIHFGISTKTPIVLEGSCGQGKSKAIDYYCKLTGLKPIKITITKYTKIDDLFGKTVFKTVNGVQTLVVAKTEFCKALECTDNTINTLIILEGINNATPAILGIINDIFGPKGSKILVNGTPITKNYINLICIFNSTDDMTKEKLPINIINNSLYYIVDNPSNQDIKDIILNLFERENTKNKDKKELQFTQEEAKQFYENFIKSKEIAENGIGEFAFTLNEVKKYISLRTSLPEIDKTFFMTIIFQHHFTQGENILKAQKNLNLDSFLFNPSISYTENHLKFYASLSSKNSNKIKVKIKKPKISEYKLINKFNSMTLSEKLCFLFLLCCIKSDKVPIIQGLTASGKSYIVMLLAELLGYKLNIYQLNANSGISIFTGQSIMKDDFNDTEKTKINEILKLINIEDIRSFNKLNVKTLEKVFNEFDKKIKKLKDKIGKEKEKEQYIEAKNELIYLTSTMSRFQKKDSEFIKGIREGNFICLDGIETASEQISQKLGTLCGELKTLNIYESGDNDLIFDKSNINKNFRLFIIYNPLSKGAKKIDQVLFNNCIKFTMPSIDLEPRDMTTLLYKNISDSKNESSFWSDFCGRLASYHKNQVLSTMNNTELIAGGANFTSRILTFISRDYNKTFKKIKINIEEWLKCVLEIYYWRSYISYNNKNRKDFEDKAYNIIQKKPEPKFKVDEELDYKIEFKDIINDLKMIQNYATNIIKSNNFSFKIFVDNCLRIPANKIKIRNIANNIEDTITLLDNNLTMDPEIKAKFYQINIIKDILRNIENNFDKMSNLQEMKKLEDEELLKNNDIKKYLLRLKLLNELLKHDNSNILYDPTIKIDLLCNPNTTDLCYALDELLKYKNKICFNNLIKLLFEFPTLFKIIKDLYPFDEFNGIKELKYNEDYIRIWSYLYEQKSNILVRIGKEKYSLIFNESIKESIIPYFILNEKNSLLLSKGSYLYYNKQYFYIDEASDKNTKEIIDEIYEFFNLKKEKMEKLNYSQLFTATKSIPMISRILSIILNFEKFPNIINYLKHSLSYLEEDTINTMEIIIDNIDYKNIIKNLLVLKFFCEKDSSILWKYRNSMDIDFVNSENEINFENEIFQAEEEIKNINNLKICFDDEIIKKYRDNLTGLISKFLIGKRYDENNKENMEYIKKTTKLIDKINTNCKKNSKIKDLILKEINNFIKSKNINKKLYEQLDEKVEEFLEFNKDTNIRQKNYLKWPRREISTELDLKNMNEENKFYQLIFWYSKIDQEISKLISSDISYKKYLEISTELASIPEIEHIINYINEKKSDQENNNLSNDQRKIVKSMIRAEFLSKFMYEKYNMDKLKNFIDNINNKMNEYDIREDEYFYFEGISDKFSPNLKIKIPKFQPHDIFHLFFKYNNNDKYKIGEVLDEKTTTIGKISDKIIKLLDKEFKDAKDITNEIGCFLYQEITGAEIWTTPKIIVQNMKKDINSKNFNEKKKKELQRISDFIDYIYKFTDVIINRNYNNFILDDFYKLLNEDNKLMETNNILKKAKEDSSLYNPLFIYYIQSNTNFIDKLFNLINSSDESIIYDLSKENKIEYIPFWLFILRNLSSMNFIDFDISENITKKNIIEKIKTSIISHKENGKIIPMEWINLIKINVNEEIRNININSFLKYFKGLIENIDIQNEDIRLKILNILEEYYNIIIDHVFEDKFDELLSYDLQKDSLFSLISYDPSKTIYNKLKKDINEEFQKNLNILKINEKIKIFLEESENRNEKIISLINESNEILLNEKFNELLNDHNIKVGKILNEIDEILNKNNDLIDKLRKVNLLDEEDHNNLENYKYDFEKLKKYGLFEDENEKNYYYKIEYEVKEDKKYDLLLDDYEIKKIDKKKGNLYFVTNESLEILKNKLKINEIINEKKDNDEVGYDKPEEYEKLENKKEEELKELEKNIKEEHKEKEENKEEEKDKKKLIIDEIGDNIENIPIIEDIFKFEKAEKYCFSKYNKKEENEIRDLIDKNVKPPKRENIYHYDKITLGGNEKDNFIKEISNLNKNLETLNIIINNIIKNLINKDNSNELRKQLQLFKKDIKDLFKLNINRFENLNDYIRKLENEYNYIFNKINSYSDSFNKDLNIPIENFLELKENKLFKCDFKMFNFPKEKKTCFVKFDNMNINSQNIFIPIINIDENKLKCCYDTLNINLGKICPIYYKGKFKINIISFVNQDLMMKIEDYKSEEINNNEIIEKEKIKNEGDDDEDKEEENIEKEKNKEINQLNNIKLGDENEKNENIEHELISVLNYVKKDEKAIQIFVEIPSTFEEKTIELSCKLIIKTLDEKECFINIKIRFSLILLNILLSCKQYNLINNYNYLEEKNAMNELYYKLDVSTLSSNEYIDFEIVNNYSKDDMIFCVSVKSLENNTSKKPELESKYMEKNKIKNSFQIIIPNYNSQQIDEIPRLNCIYEIMINENFIIYIIIDAVIKSNIYKLLIYDFFTKNYVENEVTIYLSEKVIETLKKKNYNMKLKFAFFSTDEKNKKFSLEINGCRGIQILPEKKNYEIKNRSCIFICNIKIEYISNNIMTSYLTVNLNDNKINIKINFAKNPAINKDSIIMYERFSLNVYHNNNYIEVNKSNYYSLPNYYFISPFEFAEQIIDFSKDNFPNYYQNIQYLNLNLESDKFATDTKGMLIIKEQYLKEYSGNYFYEKSSFPIFLKYFNDCFPLIDEDNYNLKNEKIQYIDIEFPNEKEIKTNYHNNDWYSRKIYLKNAKKIIFQKRPYYLNNKYSPSYYDITEASNIINEEIFKYMNKFRKFIDSYCHKCREKNITFECIIYHIFKNPFKMMENIIKFLPENKKPEFQDIYNYYKWNNPKNNSKDKEILLHNFIYHFHKFYIEQKNKFKNIDYKIKIGNPLLEKRHEELLFAYIHIPTKNPELPTECKNYLNKLESSKPKEEIKDYSKSKKINIKGDQSEIVEENTIPQVKSDIINNENIHLDNDIKIDFPDIKLFCENYSMNIKNINEFLNKYIIYCRIFPLYIRHLKKNKLNLDEAIEKYSLLFGVYNSIKTNKKNIITKIIAEEYIKYFEEMIIKLKKANIKFDGFDALEGESQNEYSYIQPPEKKELYRKEDKWENKKIFEEKKKEEFEKNVLRKIEKSRNMAKGKMDFNLDETMISYKETSMFEEDDSLRELNSLIDIKIEQENDIKNLALNAEEVDYDNIDLGKENIGEGNKLTTNKVANENDQTKSSRIKFEDYEKKFNEDYALKYIVDNLNKLGNDLNSPNMLVFKFEKTKDYINTKKITGTKVDDNILNNRIDMLLKEKEILSIDSLIKDSKFLTLKIIHLISNLNYLKVEEEIPFKNIEAHILVDCARTISNENRVLNMLFVCGLANALNNLEINYSLNLIGDSAMKVRIKETSEPHSELALQKLYDCCFIKRNVTQLASCVKYFLDYSKEDKSINSVYYVFSNGFDDELKKLKAWQLKIFNEVQNSFCFVFIKSNIFYKEKNKKYENELNNLWNNFSENFKRCNSCGKVVELSLKDIKNEKMIDTLVLSLSEVLLRTANNEKYNKDKLVKSKFNIKNQNILEDNYINYLYSNITENLNKQEFNSLYIKKNKLPINIKDNQNEQKEFKIFCQNTGKIIRYDNDTINIDMKNKIIKLAKIFKEKRERLKLKYMNTIFKPNLPTQAVLCEEGTHLDIIELIKYSINKIPNPRLYREIRDGFVKNYGVSIIIDTSNSCLNETAFIHTLQTIRILFSSFIYDNIPCLDVIITREKEPVILCSEKSSNEILNEKSAFWPVFFSCLKPVQSSDLASAIKSAYNLNRARRSDYTNYIFVLTDGLYNISERNRIIGVVNNCFIKNINVFGIGVGICPIGIEKLFPQIVYSMNPYNLLEGISYCFGDVSKFKDYKMESFVEIMNIDNINAEIKNVINVIKNPKFKELKKFLNNVEISLESFPFHQEDMLPNENGENPEGEGGMYDKNFYQGQWILILMCFSSNLKTQKGALDRLTKEQREREMRIIPENINRKINGEDCIESIVGYYGYKVKVVKDYEEAINELIKTNEEGRCFYNSLWVMSGREVNDMPSGKKDAACYINQFVDCMIQFWKNGGSLVLMAENEPMTFQVNQFLKKADFDGEKVEFLIEGDNPGGKILLQDKSGNLEKDCSFNALIHKVNNVQRESLAKNLKKLYEGLTVSYANGKSLKPFIPFSKDSKGCINSLFYNGKDRDNGEGEGDIFIDCSYTKFFLEMNEKGTYRYLQNLSAFIGSAERRFKISNHPREYRPKKVNFTFRLNYDLYKFPSTNIDICYLVDTTGSMSGSIEKVKNYCIKISDILNSEMCDNEFRFGAIFYADPINIRSEINRYTELTSDINSFKNYVDKITLLNGGDGPEDWAGGYEICVNKMNWENGIRIIIHIADAPAHSRLYNDGGDGGDYSSEGPKLDNYIKKCSNMNINIVAFKIGSSPNKSFERVKSIYNNNGKYNFKMTDFDQNRTDSSYFVDLVVNSVKGVTA